MFLLALNSAPCVKQRVQFGCAAMALMAQTWDATNISSKFGRLEAKGSSWYGANFSW